MKTLKTLAFCCALLGHAPVFADISVTPLGAVRTDAVGLVPPGVSGIPADFWGDADTFDIASAFPRYQPSDLAVVHSILRRIALAEISPPVGASSFPVILTARLRYLLSLGALDQADALVSLAPVTTPELFDIWFHINAMRGDFSRACAPLQKNGTLAKLPEKIFCLAQNGDWQGAEISLTLADTLGQIDTGLSALLHRFLDREEFESIAIPRPTQPMQPIERILRSEMNLSLGTYKGLDLDYGALDGRLGWQAQIKAGESLARSGAIPPDTLLSILQKERPSASGGVWDRVASVQRLIQSLSNPSQHDTSETLQTAWREMTQIGLGSVLAQMVGESVAALPLPPEAQNLQINLALLHPDFDLLADPLKAVLPASDLRHAILIQNFADAKPKTPLEIAIYSAFTSEVLGPNETDLLARSPGLASLEALLILKGGRESDPRRISVALQTLSRAGLYTEAQQIALSLLILTPAARE